tara:strand:- start:118 stop:564 length:447 start_codon:yes stop_codon:yes gene_type:complete
MTKNNNVSEDEWEALTKAALSAMDKAYAPYSQFPVGAALLTLGGDIVPGCNVENASYGLTICAERTAIAAAIVQGKQEFKACVVVTNTAPPSSPCGVCRQVLHEFAPDLPVRMVNPSGDVLETNIATLLPQSFDKKQLIEGAKDNKGA